MKITFSPDQDGNIFATSFFVPAAENGI